MSTDAELELMAHLMRRAGFGATRGELEARLAKGYEATVEELLQPGDDSELEKDLVDRYYIEIDDMRQATAASGWWLYRMINSGSPLRERMTLFWLNLFATGYAKLNFGGAQWKQYKMLKRDCMGDLRTLLIGLSKDPANIYWLDNSDNHKDSINENYGRELLELFSMGIGNYTEDDVKMAARAFTGWTYKDPLPRRPYLNYYPGFEYRPWDHDDSVKTFLGETGRFNGEDIVEIIVKQPATARFIARQLYDFFVADEPQVPAWPYTPPNNPEAVELLAQTYLDSGYEIHPVLQVLFNSDFFKNAHYSKVKSPVELVVGVLRLVGDYTTELGTFPKHGLSPVAIQTGYMGQQLFNPPSVEGWHTGKEWIDSGALVQRVNFAAAKVGDASLPGVRFIIDRLAEQGPTLSPEVLVDGCLELMSVLNLEEGTRRALVRHAEGQGELRHGTPEERRAFEARVTETMQLIVATSEFQSG